jgi:hypothetical protein
MPSTILDGYENRDPTPRAPFFADLKVPIKPVNPISQRILNNIESLEAKGETARHASFVVIPESGIWKKMGNKTFYRLFGLRYIQHGKQKNGLQDSIDKAKSRVFVKDANYNVATVLTLKPGIALEGESMPQLTSVDPTAPENITFTTNSNGNTGTVLSTTGTNDCFTGTLLRTVSVTNVGIGSFTNGFNIGAANVLGISNSTFSRILFSGTTTPLFLTNFQMLRLDQIYAWIPATTGPFVKAVNNNTNWNGGNSYWSDLFAHGCKNVNGAIQIIATVGNLNLVEAHRVQVNMLDANFAGSTSGYGLYLSGALSSALCSWNRFIALNLEGGAPRSVRLEDWSVYNYIDLSFDQASSFQFSLKKNATAQAPTNNILINTSNAGSVTTNIESDNFNNFLITSVPLTPVTGTYPSGISGVGIASFNGTNFTTMFGGGSGQNMVGGTTSNSTGNLTATSNIVSQQVPAGESVEVGGEMIVTAYTSGSIQFQVSYTDKNSNAQTVILPLIPDNGVIATAASGTGNYRTAPVTLRVLQNTNIILKTIGSFSLTYQASGFVRATG